MLALRGGPREVAAAERQVRHPVGDSTDLELAELLGGREVEQEGVGKVKWTNRPAGGPLEPPGGVVEVMCQVGGEVPSIARVTRRETLAVGVRRELRQASTGVEIVSNGPPPDS